MCSAAVQSGSAHSQRNSMVSTPNSSPSSSSRSFISRKTFSFSARRSASDTGIYPSGVGGLVREPPDAGAGGRVDDRATALVKHHRDFVLHRQEDSRRL